MFDILEGFTCLALCTRTTSAGMPTVFSTTLNIEVQ